MKNPSLQVYNNSLSNTISYLSWYLTWYQRCHCLTVHHYCVFLELHQNSFITWSWLRIILFRGNSSSKNFFTQYIALLRGRPHHQRISLSTLVQSSSTRTQFLKQCRARKWVRTLSSSPSLATSPKLWRKCSWIVSFLRFHHWSSFLVNLFFTSWSVSVFIHKQWQ